MQAISPEAIFRRRGYESKPRPNYHPLDWLDSTVRLETPSEMAQAPWMLVVRTSPRIFSTLHDWGIAERGLDGLMAPKWATLARRNPWDYALGVEEMLATQLCDTLPNLKIAQAYCTC